MAKRLKPETPDSKPAETSAEFEERFSTMSSSAYTLMGMALGSRLGLFHQMTLMEEPWTPQELAEAGNWKERYVLEWLGAMVCGGIVDVVPSADGDRYFLPQHRRQLLTGPSVHFQQALPMVSSVHENIVACFSKNGPKGVPYEKYPKFHEFFNDLRKKMDWNFIQHFNELTPGLTKKLESGGRFLGVGCSTGAVDCMYAAKYPNSTFIGVDINENAICQAKEKARNQGLQNVEFFVYDVCKIPEDWTETFDGVIAFDVLHDVPHPERAARELRRVLKVGGMLLVLDVFAHSRIADNSALGGSAMMYIISLYHCMPVSLHAGGIGAGAMWGRENVIDCLKAAGFDDVLEPEAGSAHYVCIKK